MGPGDFSAKTTVKVPCFSDLHFFSPYPDAYLRFKTLFGRDVYTIHSRRNWLTVNYWSCDICDQHGLFTLVSLRMPFVKLPATEWVNDVTCLAQIQLVWKRAMGS